MVQVWHVKHGVGMAHGARCVSVGLRVAWAWHAPMTQSMAGLRGVTAWFTDGPSTAQPRGARTWCDAHVTGMA